MSGDASAATTAVGFSAGDGLRLAGDSAGEVRVWLDGGPRRYGPAEGAAGGSAVRVVAASEHGALVGAADATGAVVVWDGGTGAIVDRIAAGRPLRQLLLLEPRRYLAVSDELQAYLWRPSGAGGLEGVTLEDPGGQPLEAEALGVEGDRLRVLAGFHFFECRVGERRAVERLSPIKAHQFLYTDGLVGLSPRGRWCFVHWDEYAVIDLDTGARCFQHPIVRRARVAALSEVGPRLVVGTSDGRLVAVDPDGRRLLEKKVSDNPITQVAISDRGDRVLYLDEGGASELVVV